MIGYRYDEVLLHSLDILHRIWIEGGTFGGRIVGPLFHLPVFGTIVVYDP